MFVSQGSCSSASKNDWHAACWIWGPSLAQFSANFVPTRLWRVGWCFIFGTSISFCVSFRWMSNKNPVFFMCLKFGDAMRSQQIHREMFSRWWFHAFLMFIPSFRNHPIWRILFQMGWFNHQLVFFSSHTCFVPFVFLVFMLQVRCLFAMSKHSRTIIIMDVSSDHLRLIVWKLVHHVFARSTALFKTFPMMKGIHMFQVVSWLWGFGGVGGIIIFYRPACFDRRGFQGRIANTPPGALLIGEGNMFQRINRYRHPPNTSSCRCFRHVWGSKYLLRRCLMSRECQQEFRCLEILILEEINMFQNNSSHASFPRTFLYLDTEHSHPFRWDLYWSIDMKNYCFVESLLSSTWRIIPFSKWWKNPWWSFSSPKDRVNFPFQMGFAWVINGADPNHLQVLGWSSKVPEGAKMFIPLFLRSHFYCHDLGVSLNGGKTPQFTPQNDHF